MKIRDAERGDPARLPAQVVVGWGKAEKVCREENNILYWADYNSQGKTKNLLYRHDESNEPTKEEPH
jgi:hypothetical protein